MLLIELYICLQDLGLVGICFADIPLDAGVAKERVQSSKTN